MKFLMSMFTIVTSAGLGFGPAGLLAAEHGSQERLGSLNPPWYDHEADSWQHVGIVSDTRDEDWDVPEIPELIPLLIYLAIGLALAFLIWFMVQAVQRKKTNDRLPQSTINRQVQASVSALPFQVDESLQPEDELQRALAQRDWSAAVQWLYACQLFLLHQHQHIVLRKDKTNKSYLREMRSQPQLAQALQQTIRVFERSHFGGELPSENIVHTLQQTMSGFRKAVIRDRQTVIPKQDSA